MRAIALGGVAATAIQLFFPALVLVDDQMPRPAPSITSQQSTDNDAPLGLRISYCSAAAT